MPVSSVSVASRAEPIEGSATLEIEVLMFATIAPRINVVRMIPAFAGADPNAGGAAAPVVVDTSTSCQLASPQLAFTGAFAGSIAQTFRTNIDV